jgi:hypothetical protein
MKPIPQVPYERFKETLYRHEWVHYLFHTSYCLFKDNSQYKFYTPKEWLEK